MKQLLKYKGIAILLMILLIIGFVIYMLNQHQLDTRRIKTEASLTTFELLNQLESDDRANLDKFIEKAIEIKGELYQVTEKEGVYSLLLKGESDKTLVLCEMQVDQNPMVQNLMLGDEVVVKGILKGFLMDVILLNCIVITEEVND